MKRGTSCSTGILEAAMKTVPAVAIYFGASTFHSNLLVNGQLAEGCESFYASSTAGYPSDVSIDTASYFTCTGDAFIVAVDVWFTSHIESVEWTCSNGEESNISGETGFADGSASFDVGMTVVQTGVKDDSLPWLGDMYFGGYDLTYDETNVTFTSTGPFGDDSSEYLPGTTSSSCGSNAFAIGAVVRSSTNFVYGIQLLCAEITEACSPPNYPTIATEDSSTSKMDSTSTADDSTTNEDPPSQSEPTTTDDSTTADGSTTLDEDTDDSALIDNDPEASAISNQNADDEESWQDNDAVVGSIVGGALLFAAIVAGILLYFSCRHRPSKTLGTSSVQAAHHPPEIFDTSTDPRGPPPPYNPEV